MYNSNFMAIAEQEAESNLKTQEGGPFGCVIVKNNEIVAKGHNTVLKCNDPTAHGEIVTLRKAGTALNNYDLSGCELYTNAFPCPMCLSAIIWANIKVIYYGNTAQDTKKIGFRDDFIYKFINSKFENKTVLKIERHDQDKTIKSFDDFINSQNKIIY